MSMTEFDKKGSEAARAAWLYYHEELTQGEIAQELSVSRSTVTRLLQRAKNEGLVHITLNVTSGTFKAERELERVYGLEKVRIVPDANDDATQKRWLGHVAAEMMVQTVADNAIVAVSWGTTLQAMADALVGQRPLSGAQIVALVGSLHNATPGANTNEVAKQFGQFFNVPARPLLAPVFVQDEATAQGLANDPGIREALELARKASIVIYSFGAMDNETTMFRLGHLAPEQWTFLKDHGAVGDIACRWIDRDGEPVEPPPSINPIGVSLEEIHQIPQRLAVAGGQFKQEIVLAGLRGGFVTTLVTDERTADYLLKHR
jgi:DNA-binding transcriptional regulator LsrR (DeoR family)